MTLPESSRFIFCESEEGEPQALSANDELALLSGFLGYAPKSSQFVEIVVTHPSRARGLAAKNSLRQRIDAAARVGHPNIATILEMGEIESDSGDGESNPYFVSEYVEGERLPDYLNRCKLQRQLATSLSLQLAEVVAALSDHPRLLSAITLEDFAVTLDQGQFLKLVLTDFGFEREEFPLSDTQLARRWIQTVGIVQERIVNGQAIPLTFDEIKRLSSSGNPYSLLISRINNQSGAEAARTMKGLKAQVLASSGLSEDALNYLDPDFRSISRAAECPTGPLQRLITEGEIFTQLVEDRYTLLHDHSAVGFSPFRIPARLKSEHDDETEHESAKANAARVTLNVMPPERLIDNSGTATINRKMSDPYLKAHPSALRTRFLLCDSDFSLVVSERLNGFHLPALLANRGKLSSLEALEILNQMDRALTHFESSDLSISDITPWQIDIHFEELSDPRKSSVLTRTEIRNWPAWDVKIRVEKPAEVYFESAHSPWRHLYDRFDCKAFPALAIWLMECDRFEWALMTGNENKEPLSWNPKINQLMESAIGFYDSECPKHRGRLLELLREIIEKEARPEPVSIIPKPQVLPPVPALDVDDPEILTPIR